MVGITGKRSSIVKEFLELSEQEPVFGTTEELPLNLDEYLLCAGVLHGKSAREITTEEAIEAFKVNFLSVIQFCDHLFAENKNARVCIIGSESGYKGSFDMVYAGTKAATHLYIEQKRLPHPGQHLVGVAPTIIEDSGMTQRRDDLQELLERGKERHLGRWLQAGEVARIAHFALQEDALCNSVVRVTGGK